MVRRITIIIVTVSLLFLSGQIFAANAVSVSKIDGFDSTSGGLMANTPIRFYINYEVGANAIVGIGNAYRFYSTNGATWEPIFAQPTVMLSNYFDGLAIFLEFSVDGSGADTLDLFAFTLDNPGLPSGFDSNLFFIETRFSEKQIGKTVCLDTTSRANVDPFSWISNIEQVIPSWDGPHCFEIVDCCSGNRGDINGDGKGPNILDLTRLVDYIFRGFPAPDCKLESDVNGDGTPYNIIDLTFIVDFMHRAGPAAGPCPS